MNSTNQNRSTTSQSGNFIGSSSGSGSVSQVSFGSTSTLTVNGKTYTGRKIEQLNGRIFVDDRDVTDEVGTDAEGHTLRELSITVQGNVDKVEAHGCHQLTIEGNVGMVESVSGSIEIIGNVTGSVESMSGSIKCGKVAGNVKTMSGSIKTN